MRKRTLFRLRDRFKISITPIPKVKLRVFYRQDGSWHVAFGRASFDHLVKTGQYWDDNGKKKYKGKSSWWGGQGYVINRMWHYIQEQAYRDNINEMDLA